MEPQPPYEKHAITGAFGYTGRYIAQRLINQGKIVVNLTGHPNHHNPFGIAVKSHPFNFENPDLLEESLEGVQTLYNTYWVRFSYGTTTFAKAVQNTKILINAAKQAGVRRLVHISITNPSQDSPLPYFRGKGELEDAIIHSGLSYAILRPTVVFGKEDILINNIAYLLRHFPLFVIPGDGEYLLQPIFVEDLVDLAVQLGGGHENLVIDAIGPETYSFNDLVLTLKDVVHSSSWILHLPPQIALILSRLIGILVRDVVLTQDEVMGLMGNYLVTKSPPTGKTSFKNWVFENAVYLGNQYSSELARHYRESQKVS